MASSKPLSMMPPLGKVVLKILPQSRDQHYWGLIGTVLMDIVGATFLVAGMAADTFFSMVGEKLGYGTLVGILVHNLVGITGGIVFSVLVQTIKVLRIDSMRKGLLLGIAAGVVTIPLGCIPLAIWLNQPILDVIAFSTLPHLVWGTVLGWTVAYGLISSGHRSEAVKNFEA
jgi:ethanolamine transporter EutH